MSDTGTQQTRLTRQQRRALERKAARPGAALASGAALTLGAAMVAAPAAQAATFTVTHLDDAGPGSLRQAIEDANAAAGPDVIDFQDGLSGAIILTSGQLSITDSVDIQGPGAAVIAVSGNTGSRVFYLYNGSALLDVTISGLTITGGSAAIGAGIVDFDENLVLDGVNLTGNSAAIDGGGLWASGLSMSLTLRNSTVSGNTADDDGGGIYVGDTGGPLLLQTTVLSGNLAGDDGGGVYFSDPDDAVTIDQSTISGNFTGGRGGGIYLYDTDGGTFIIQNSTLSGNSATDGGGAFFYQPDTPVIIENSTISGNTASATGGGIYFYAVNTYYGGEAILRHSTIAGNTAATGGGVFAGVASVTIDQTIVGDNTASNGPDLANGADGSFDVRFSLIEDPGTANVNDNGGNVLNQDPQLGPLANNGGPTETHLPAPTSPAVNAGDPAFAPPPATDQRGLPRVSGGRIDIGAVELAPAGTLQFSISSYMVHENGVTATITVTRTGGSDGAVSVDYQTSNGTATQPADYQTTAGTLNWASGDAAPKTFQVPIVDDLLVEGDETVNLALSNPQGAALGSPATAVLTIVDDDVAPAGTLQFSISSYTVNENGVTATITVTRTGGSNGAVSVDYQTSNGTATQPADYQPAAGTLNWASGDTAPKTFQVPIVNDLLVEGDETVNLALSNPQGTALGSPSTAVLTIVDDDLVPVGIPTLGDAGKLLFAGLCGLSALLALRRRRQEDGPPEV